MFFGTCKCWSKFTAGTAGGTCTNGALSTVRLGRFVKLSRSAVRANFEIFRGGFLSVMKEDCD